MKRIPTVRVGVFWKASKGRYFLRWTDPFTGKRRSEQTEITTRNKRGRSRADRLAVTKEQELKESLRRDDFSWDAFEEKYKQEHLKFTSTDNQQKWNAVVKFLHAAAAESQQVYGELMLSDVKPLFLSEVETLIRSKLSGGSVSSYVATLRSGLSWAASMEMMDPLPRRRSRGRVEHVLPAMRLNPITRDDLKKMKDVTDSVVGKRYGQSVKDYLEALWLSGCRMCEPLQIHATRRNCHRPLNLAGEHPKFCWVNTQKNRRDVIARVTKDFAADVERRVADGGFLYQPRCETGLLESRTSLSKVVADIGRKADVWAEEGKAATAKHFRSSFVTRWSIRGMPIALIQEMVRHRSRSTTERYYVGDLSGKIDFDESRFGDQSGDQA
ncbi:site-specific integrase [Planctomycetes bacterium TBK1r]|uniref:Phage integrase family protein n=1 Tax=Stieleria magnilauensis TaxID=2527963 RepID=A0ABX5XVQ9_9BACT|nr:Phage integrase family protein [Planctomycetes bacterium TBK1r]